MSRIVALVPTLGLSPLAMRLARDLERELAPLGGSQLWIVQGSASLPADLPLSFHSVSLPIPVGFTAAVNAGLARLPVEAQWVALINDDCQLAPGWLEKLLRLLEREPLAGAAQGVNLRPGKPERLDGYGIGWNRWFEAVQLGYGEPLEVAPLYPIQVPGVSATAALYRRAALEAVAGPELQLFDPALESHYEDVELSLQLRAQGWTCWCQPEAKTIHLGAATTQRTRPLLTRVEVRGNRWAVVARWLGRWFWAALPRILLRDMLDLYQAVRSRDWQEAQAIPRGWSRAIRLLPRRLHFGSPRPQPPLSVA